MIINRKKPTFFRKSIQRWVRITNTPNVTAIHITDIEFPVSNIAINSDYIYYIDHCTISPFTHKLYSYKRSVNILRNKHKAIKSSKRIRAINITSKH